MPEIKLTHVTKRWGKFYAVDDLSLDMEDNSFITLLGPSGCGKTTRRSGDPYQRADQDRRPGGIR